MIRVSFLFFVGCFLELIIDRVRVALALRHFELLTNVEAAQVLGIQKDAAAKRRRDGSGGSRV